VGEIYEGVMAKIKFLVADCGHIIRAGNLGGKYSKCSRLCCKDRLTIIDDEMLRSTCLKRSLKELTQSKL